MPVRPPPPHTHQAYAVLDAELKVTPWLVKHYQLSCISLAPGESAQERLSDCAQGLSGRYTLESAFLPHC